MTGPSAEKDAGLNHLYPGPLREVLSEVLGMLRVEATVDDIEVLADSVEKSEWLRDQIEKAFLSGCEDAFAFDRNLLRQMRRARVTPPGVCDCTWNSADGRPHGLVCPARVTPGGSDA